MKRFFTYWVMWLFATLVFTFFFGTVFLDGRNIYLLMMLVAAAFAVLSSAFESQSDRIKSLEARVDTLEKVRAQNIDTSVKDEQKENRDERV